MKFQDLIIVEDDIQTSYIDMTKVSAVTVNRFNNARGEFTSQVDVMLDSGQNIRFENSAAIKLLEKMIPYFNK